MSVDKIFLKGMKLKRRKEEKDCCLKVKSVVFRGLTENVVFKAEENNLRRHNVFVSSCRHCHLFRGLYSG